MPGARPLSRDALAAIDARSTAADIEAVLIRARQRVGPIAHGTPGPEHEPDIWPGWGAQVERLSGGAS